MPNVTHVAIEATKEALDDVVKTVTKLPGVKPEQIVIARVLNDKDKFVVAYPADI